MSTQVNTWEGLGYKELGEWIQEKTTEQNNYFKSRSDGKGSFNMDTDEVEIVRHRNKALEDANTRFAQLKEVDRIYQQTVDASKSLKEPMQLVPFESANGQANQMQQYVPQEPGALFTASKAYKSVGFHNDMTQYAVTLDDFDFTKYIKTTLTTTAGYAPVNARGPSVVDFAARRPVVGDLVPTDSTNVSIVKFMQEGTPTNAAAGVSENAAKPESALSWTEVTVPVEVIAHYIPVTNQQLDDVPGMEGLINRRMSQLLLLTEENYLLSGTGTPPQVTGFLVKAGTNTQALGADTNLDCIYKGMQAVRVVGYAEPTGVVLHPNNFATIRLAKTTTGEYIYGDPSVAGPETVFGKPVIQTTAMTAGTGLVGDFVGYSHISRRMGVTIIVGMINDDMIKNKKTILAEMRESLEIYRPAAFTKCTGLT
jgi:HK97 family phage major capsid protein